MIFDIDSHPILKFLEDNKLKWLEEILAESGYDGQKEIISIMKSFKFFSNKELVIQSISRRIHNSLLDTKLFIRDRKLLSGTPETVGLILLPETLIPNFDNVPSYVDVNPTSYPINAIAYSWLNSNNHCKIEGTYDPEDHYDDSGRTLIIMPFFDERITQATDPYYLTDYDETFGWEYSEGDGRNWYGMISDYIMSFILFNNNREIYDFIISDIPSKSIVIGFNNNKIEVID